MKHAAFTQIIAHETQVPQKTVAVYVRFLKSGGLLTSGARGVNAPDMTLTDLVRMLIAMCATDRPSEAVDAVRDYRTAKTGVDWEVAVEGQSISIPKGAELEEMLLAVLKLPFVFIWQLGFEFRINPTAGFVEMSFGDQRISFHSQSVLARIEDAAFSRFSGLQTTRGLRGDPIANMALGFSAEQRSGKTWEEMKSDGDLGSVIEDMIFKPSAEEGADG